MVITASMPLIVSGCAAAGKNYSRPQLPTPAMYRFADQTQAESLADAPWWRIFTDDTLQSLIREAIAKNLDLQAAIARVEQARAQAGIAKSFLYPTVDLTGAYTVEQNITKTDDDVRQGGTYGFQLAWEIDLFGRLRREKEAAFARMLASEQGRRGVLVTLIGDVTSTYFLLRQLDWQLFIARQTLVVNDQTVTYFQNRLDGGVSNRLEVDRIRANREVTAASIPVLERQIAATEDSLSLLLGRVPGHIERETVDDRGAPTSVSPALPALPPPIPPGVPATLLERRPDVMQAEELLVAANADVGAAKARFFPTIALTGLAGGISGDVANLLGGAGGVWALTPSLLQPVYNAGRLKRNLELERARMDEAFAEYKKSALNAYREVADALVTIAKLAEERVHQETGVLALQDAADLARARYETGLASYLEILTADQDLYERQQLLAATRGEEFRARSELYRALGGGWQP
jgi:multidrug efflux system outer membrane protein